MQRFRIPHSLMPSSKRNQQRADSLQTQLEEKQKLQLDMAGQLQQLLTSQHQATMRLVQRLAVKYACSLVVKGPPRQVSTCLNVSAAGPWEPPRPFPTRARPLS